MLTADRNTESRDGELFEFPVAADVRIFAGAMVALNADGNAVIAAATSNLVVVGRAEQFVSNLDGAAGDVSVRVKRGVFLYANSTAADEIVRSDINATAYVVDEETLAKTNGTGTRPAAGTILDVEERGVWVRI